MKNRIALLSIALFLTACVDQKESTLEDIIATEDIEAIQQKRNVIVAKQQEINEQIKQLDETLAALNPEKNIPLITSFTANDTLFKHYLEIQGSVETDQNIIITPEMGGVLQRVYVTEGQYVNKGQILASIDDGGMSLSIAQVQVQADLAKTTFERQERLWNQNIGSEIQYLQAKTAYEGQLNTINSMKQQLTKASMRADRKSVV